MTKICKRNLQYLYPKHNREKTNNLNWAIPEKEKI
jgi:hypothetical protein